MAKRIQSIDTAEGQESLALPDVPGDSADLHNDESGLPLTAALIRVSVTTLSFATPGHRQGRSCKAGQ
jgi:hypothetical protein